MKKLIYCFLCSLLLNQAKAQTHQVTFKLSITEIAHPDSVAVVWLLFPTPLTKPQLLEKPDVDGFYKLIVSFPDSVMGKTLIYRYQTANKMVDIRRRVKLDNYPSQILTDKWAYLDGIEGKVKPSQPIPVFHANSAEEKEILAKPYIGVTTDGTKTANLFPIKKTGVSTLPIKNVVIAFLNSLSVAQKAKCTFSVESNEWRRWHNIELYERTGVGLEELSKEQKALAFDILKAGLSPKGLKKAKNIMCMEGYLSFLVPENQLLGNEKYWFTFMGTPSDTEPWGWQIDGHHLVINYFVLGDQVVMTPTFMGSEPTYIASGLNKGLRTYEVEEKLGLDFYKSLNQEQKDKARIWHKKETDYNRTEAFRDNEIIAKTGVSAKELSESQKKQFIDLIANYVGDIREGHAKIKMEEVITHLDETNFTWVQSDDLESPFYYRIHSPVVLIEFDHQNPVSVPWDRSKPYPGPVKTHIHTVVRTPNGNDYGKDLLKEHLETQHKK